MTGSRGVWLAFALWLTVNSAAFTADKTPGPLPAADAARQAILPEGFRATVFAAEPMVVQPVSFCLDDQGRLFVGEALNYGKWQPTGKDRIVVLTDRDGDGQADDRQVFFEGFNYITGIEVGFGGVWVISPPRLYFVPDQDGDLRPDGEPVVLFDGFGYRESRHNLVNGFTWGPDGWLYGGHGRTSPSDVGRPGTPPAERIHCDGGVYRIHPTRLVFENFADGTTNPWGVDFDELGECFVSNCVNPHLFHMVQGGHYEPWRNRPSSRYAYERLPTIADHLHYPGGKLREMRGETEAVLALGGGHAHCGTLVYLGDRFPDSFRNTVLMCNVHGRRINHDLLERQGSGYVARHGQDFLVSADPWFMGVTLRTGPDGNIFVSDWSDTGECHTYQPHTASGRIFKVHYGTTPAAAVDLARLSDAQLVERQGARNDWHVVHARRLLQERASRPGWEGAEVWESLQRVLDDFRQSAPIRLRAMWALWVTGGLTPERHQELLSDPEESLRAWGIRLACERSLPPAAVRGRFEQLARDDRSAVVRLALAAALQRLPPEFRWGIARELVRHEEDAADANLPLMLWYALEPLVPLDLTRGLDLARECRIPRVRELIGRRAADHALSAAGGREFRPLVVALQQAEPAATADLLRGIREGVRGQKRLPLPEEWPAVYQRLRQSADPDVRRLGVELALVFGDGQAVADLWRVARNGDAPATERQQAIESLVEAAVPDLAPGLQELLSDEVVRRTAIRGLAAVPHADTPARLLEDYPAMTREERQEAIATLASRVEFARTLLEGLETGRVPRGDVSAYAARQIVALKEDSLTERLGKVWGQVRGTDARKKESLARYRKQLTPAFLADPNLDNGRRVYGTLCGNCHRLSGEGGTIGPDLTGTNRSDLDYLLSNLVDPSAEVARDYRMSQVETRGGRVVTGIVLEQSPTRIVLQTDSRQVVLGGDEVESIVDAEVSIMPEGQLDRLSQADLRDLFGFLRAPR